MAAYLQLKIMSFVFHFSFLIAVHGDFTSFYLAHELFFQNAAHEKL